MCLKKELVHYQTQLSNFSSFSSISLMNPTWPDATYYYGQMIRPSVSLTFIKNTTWIEHTTFLFGIRRDTIPTDSTCLRNELVHCRTRLSTWTTNPTYCYGPRIRPSFRSTISSNEPSVNLTHSLVIWSQTRYHYAMDPTCLKIELVHYRSRLSTSRTNPTYWYGPWKPIDKTVIVVNRPEINPTWIEHATF